ncbi:MAG TPA: HAMP domain-containing sensor histidine kinase [Bacteroidales bacterium]|nr:HAMP domain-containing sensor histidine kinase [Bacteroidales bacterium]
MRKKNTVLLLGMTSLLVIISIQLYIIIGVWKQKNEMFSITYSQRTREALGYFYRLRQGKFTSDDGFDTVRILLNDYASKTAPVLFKIKDPDSLAQKKREVLEYVRAILDREEDLSDMLSSYFASRNMEKNVSHSIIVNDLEFLNSDTSTIYQSDNYVRRSTSDRGRRPDPRQDVKSTRIFVWTQDFVGNNYILNIDYYIDFSNRKQVVFRESSATLILSLLSIFLVGTMFFITYKNLMEEKRLSNLKTDFINNMTHELKTPLSTITVAGKTLEMPQIRQNDQKILETAKLIGKQSVHLNQLINMILEISMWERTQFQLEKRTVKIEDVMKDIVESFKSGGGSNATIIEKYELGTTTTDVDVVYFTTLLNNLLSNAVKYSDKQPEIEIEGFRTEDRICIKVSDNGIGISKVDQKHIFDKFYRASTGNIHKFKGLGLGLYYVKKIAEAHGGDVDVSSKPGKGSTFTVTLPIS